MSRGPGRVQRTILALIAENPHGAWSTSELCALVYGDHRITRVRRHAVTRALRRMTLPGTWQTKCESHVKEYFLCDPCDLASMSFKVRRFQYEPRDLEPGGLLFEQVERAKRWRDGSPVEGLEMEIERQQKMLGTMKTGECRAALLRAFVENLVKLRDERSKLEPRPNVGRRGIDGIFVDFGRGILPVPKRPRVV